MLEDEEAKKTIAEAEWFEKNWDAVEHDMKLHAPKLTWALSGLRLLPKLLSLLRSSQAKAAGLEFELRGLESVRIKDNEYMIKRAEYVEAKLSAYEKAGPEDEETKRAIALMPDLATYALRWAGERMVISLRAAWAKIAELEKSNPGHFIQGVECIRLGCIECRLERAENDNKRLGQALLNEQEARLRAEVLIRRLAVVLSRIANPQCGCNPKCRCLEPEALGIYRDEARRLADEAIALIPAQLREGPNGKG